MTNLPTERPGRSSRRTNGARVADHAAACDRVRPGVRRVVGATVVADADPEIIGASQAIAAGPILAVVSIATCRARSRPSAARWSRPPRPCHRQYVLVSIARAGPAVTNGGARRQPSHGGREIPSLTNLLIVSV